jgi:hypothetical protein
MSKQDALFEAMMKQYENNSSSYTKNSSAKEYDLKNYFTTYLSDKQKTATKTIRVLPTSDGSTPFKEVHGHKMQVDGEWKTFMCLKHEKDEDCPFCEAREALLASGKDSDKELAKKYSAKKMYVVKIIDRDNEADGIKFWRFNHDYRKQGIYDKIYGVLTAIKQNITDAQTGRDLMVMIARDQNNRPIVQSISHLDPSPLSEDAEVSAEWLSDSRTWEDVYSVKPYDYLEIIVKGGVPTWDKEAKKFVDKASLTTQESDGLDEELTLGTLNVKPNVTAAAKKTAPAVKATEPDDDEDEDEKDVNDDLPF